MKYIPYNALLLLSFFSLSIQAQSHDPVKKANAANEQKADRNGVDEDVAEFLVKSADARMMDSREGKLAVEKGTTSSVKKYGKLMVKDQALLLAEIKKLATKRNITLPSDISDKKENGKDELSEKNGEEFDKKFIKMMILDHERDVKLFEKATECKDNEVSVFARKYLPTIQYHLDKINVIKGTAKD